MENLKMLSRTETMVRLGRRLAEVKTDIEADVLDELIMMYREGLLEVLFDEEEKPRFQLAPHAKSVH
jgi:hypothetical protein